MQFIDVVRTSQAVASTRSRLAKRRAIAELLARTEEVDVEVVVTYLAGELRQRRTGLGWASLKHVPDPAPTPTLSVRAADERFAAIAALAGPGSATMRVGAAAELFGLATADEQAYLRGLVAGDVRQGALDSIMLDAVAEAADVAAPVVRRAAMLAGATAPVALAALTGGAAALQRFSLTVGTPVRPMLAGTAPDVGAAYEKIGAGAALSVDLKLDGIRIQVHKRGEVVAIFTRSLDDITDRLPEVVAATRGLPHEALILDGEALAVGSDGRPRPFQETASRTSTRSDGYDVAVTPYFFDCLHVDGDDLIDVPLSERLDVLDATVGTRAVPRVTTADADAAQQFFLEAIAAGHEGVVIKSLSAPYEAGRRGAGWIKVKPRHTLDLVVLAVEWGSGRRQGWLSNIHLGARTGDGFVMLGKTFKGMTDQMLRWQTERFLELETARDQHVVHVRPEQVVEIAFDGLQRSTRYPGGVALRFARVVGYRSDKTASEADTLETVLALTGW